VHWALSNSVVDAFQQLSVKITPVGIVGRNRRHSCVCAAGGSHAAEGVFRVPDTIAAFFIHGSKRGGPPVTLIVGRGTTARKRPEELIVKRDDNLGMLLRETSLGQRGLRDPDTIAAFFLAKLFDRGVALRELGAQAVPHGKGSTPATFAGSTCASAGPGARRCFAGRVHVIWGRQGLALKNKTWGVPRAPE